MGFKQGLVIVASVLLVACKQAQIDGPVAGGIITVEELRSSTVVVSGETTFDEAQALALWPQPEWDEFDVLARRVLLGFNLLNTHEFDDDTWYLMTVTGGDDYGSEGDFVPNQVFGSVHALLPGSRLSRGYAILSPLTEAAYQFVKAHIDTLTNQQLQTALDDMALELVGDVNEDGVIDYGDVLSWSRLIHNNPALLRVAAAPLASLTQAMSDGDSDAVLSVRAADFFDASAPPGVAQAFFAANVNQPISQGKCRTCHNTSGLARNTRHIVTSGSSEAALAANVNMYRELVAAMGVNAILARPSLQVSHTGGRLLPLGSANYDIFKEFLELL